MTPRSLLALLLLAGATPARAGVVIVAKQQGGKSESTIYLEGKKVRIDEPGRRSGGDSPFGGPITIFDGDTHRLFALDDKARTYRVVTEADGQALGAKLRADLAKLPPEQRQRIEAMLKQRMEAPPPKHQVTFAALGSHQTVAGYGCDGYRKLRDGKPVDEGCFIPWSARAVTKDDLAGLLEFSRFGQALAANAFGARANPGAASPIYEDIVAAPGFPAVLDSVAGGSHRNQHRLVSIERTRIPSDRFAVPSGYTRVAGLPGSGE